MRSDHHAGADTVAGFAWEPTLEWGCMFDVAAVQYCSVASGARHCILAILSVPVLVAPARERGREYTQCHC